MHPNPIFLQSDVVKNIEFARAVGFGILTVNGESTPLVSHLPFVLNEAGDAADLHLVRSTAIARHVSDSADAKFVISGPDGYISPDWYEIPDQVPTWNYVAVHLTGRLERLAAADLPEILENLSNEFEARLAPKPIWTSEKMTDGVAEKMHRQIVPYRFHIHQVQGTWKLGQNKTDDVRLRAADAAAQQGQHSGEALATLMRSAAK